MTSSTAGARALDAHVGDVIEGQPMTLDWTNMVLHVSGSQDLSRIHHDPEFARASGHEQLFFNTGWTSAMLYRVLTDWAGADGWVAHLDFRMRLMNALGDTVVGRGVVSDTRATADGRLEVHLDMSLVNDRLGVATTGTAVTLLGTAPDRDRR